MFSSQRKTLREILVLALVLLPGLAGAQSVITGVARDATGGVLPGVTVEGASPVLIEKVRSTVTDENGLYRIVDLRPGMYTVTFSLPGFATVKREGVELPADFVLTLNAELRVGAMEETITVSGASSVVDVQTTVKRQVISRESMDLLPTGRSVVAVGQLIVGVQTNRSDVGGSTAMQKSALSLHGFATSQNTNEVDGLQASQTLTEGTNIYYWPQAFVQELVYQTSGIGLDATGGGLRSNMIPKDGGNTFNGSFFGAGTLDSWISDNVDDDLRAANFTVGNRSKFLYDTELGLGGPMKQDKLWFYVNPRYYGQHTFVAGTYVCPGCYGKSTPVVSDETGLDRQFIMVPYARLTWQMSPRNKLAGHYMWNFKMRDGNITAGTDPLTARQNFNYHTAWASAIKWTSTVTNRLMVEVGYAPNWLTWVNDPENVYERGTTEWLTTPQKTDINLGTTWNSALQTLNEPPRHVLKGQGTYVVGAHSFRAGGIYDFGYHKVFNGVNADLVQRYANGVPNSVVVYNTPKTSKNVYKLAALYAQDSWTIGRLTLNGGLRFEYLNGGYAAQAAEAGRFVVARSFEEARDLPNWKTIVPRFGAAYDLFGNAKTALKFSANRYDLQRLTGFADLYNPMAGTNLTSILAWTDLNGDDLAQVPYVPGGSKCVYLTPGCEINLAQLPTNFGVRTLNTPDPDIKRPYTIELSTGIQHQLLPRVTVDATWIRTSLKNAINTVNTLLTHDDYTPVNVVSPLDGSTFTVYNLKSNKVGQVANFDTNSSGVGQDYNIFEFNMNARLPGGLNLFGGVATERTRTFACDAPDNPNRLIFCDQRDYDIPWQTQVKVNASYTLPWQDIQVGTVIQSYAPSFLPANTAGGLAGALFPLVGIYGPGSDNWVITPTTRYAANCTGPCMPGALVVPGLNVSQLVVPLTPGNTQTIARLNQVDLSVMKAFRFGAKRLQARLDVFNSLNSNTITAVRSANFGTAAYRAPTTIPQGRTLRAGVQMTF